MFPPSSDLFHWYVGVPLLDVLDTENVPVPPSLTVVLDGCAVIENVLITVRSTSLVYAEAAAPTASILQRAAYFEPENYFISFDWFAI